MASKIEVLVGEVVSADVLFEQIDQVLNNFYKDIPTAEITSMTHQVTAVAGGVLFTAVIRFNYEEEPSKEAVTAA